MTRLVSSKFAAQNRYRRQQQQQKRNLSSSLSSSSSSWLDSSVVVRFLIAMALLVIMLNVAFFSTIQPQHRPPPTTTTTTSRSLSDQGNGSDPPQMGRTKEKKHDSTNNQKDDKQLVLQTFEDAGVVLDQETVDALPSWSQIESVVGEYPVLYNLDKACPSFRATVEGVDRNIGCSGMFNSGTNLVTRLLKENCRIPERVEKFGVTGPFHDSQGKSIGPFEAHGMRWQVPWGKHVPANYREGHSTKYATHIQKDGVLAVVTIRHPYNWMRSMCKNPYTAKWPHNTNNRCPHLTDSKRQQQQQGSHNVPLSIKYDGREDHHDSLAHLWNDWYAKYWRDADFPFVMVRFEDIIFHAKNVTTQLCECAGGQIRTDRPFQYIKDSAKEGPGHGKVTERTGMAAAWIRYSKPLEPLGGFSPADYDKCHEYLDQELMDIFHYHHAPPATQPQ